MVFFYAVQGGRCSGIFTWDRMLDATVGYPDAKINRFPTLAKAEAFMKENPATPTQAPRWSGPAYAVAVGRRMGIFRDHAAALRQTLGYSGNSLKKFDSFEEGLDRHNWRTMSFNEGDGVEIADGNPDARSSVATTEDEHSQDAGSPEGNRKRERVLDNPREETETSRPAQRCRIDRESSQPEEQDLTAFCCGSLASDSNGRHVKSTCSFPAHPEWNVVHESNCTETQAGMTAALEALKRASQQDPVVDLPVTIFTVNQSVYRILRNEVKCADEDDDLLQSIIKEMANRATRVLYVGDMLRCTDETSP